MSNGYPLISRGFFLDDQLGHRVIAALAGRVDLAIDVGAGVGAYTIPIARNLRSGANVYVFEPDPRNFTLLRRNIRENLTNALTSTTCLSDRQGKARLSLSRHNYGRNSLCSQNPPKPIVDIEVAVDTLDNFLHDLHLYGKKILLKIDVEGAEPLVIRGAMKTISNNAVTIFFEYWPFGIHNFGENPDRLLDYLSGAGMKLYHVDEQMRRIRQVGTAELVAEQHYRRTINLIATPQALDAG
jgi:FkbM family methyltransferase